MNNTNNNNPNTQNVKLDKTTKIKIISVNVNFIIKNQRRASLLNIIEKQNPDVVLLGETKLNKNHILRFENYNVIRNDRNEENPGGGTAILIKKTIKYSKISLPSLEKNKILEHTIIKCKFKSDKTLYIISAYAKCGNQKEFIPDLNKLFTLLELNKLENYYIIAGDLNAKHTNWKNPNNNPRGISLTLWLEKNNILFKTRLLSTKYPSYPYGKSFLDIVIDTRLTFHEIEDDCGLNNIPHDSDHNATSFQVSLDDYDELLLDPKHLKKDLNDLRTKLKIEFSSSISNYWKNKITNISKKDPNKMFPKINSIFRKKEISEVATLKIDPNSSILNDADINANSFDKDKDGNILIDTLQEKLDLIGAHFASINNRHFDNDRPQLNNIINKEIDTFKSQVEREQNMNTTLSCLNLNRSAESDYTKYIKNEILYNTANIPRIDNFMISLTRDFYSQASKILQNSLVFSTLYPNPMYFEKTLSSGYIPPEAFLYLDSKRYIQNNNNVPIIYHYPRHCNDKKLIYPQYSDSNDTRLPWRYNMSVPDNNNLKKKKSRSKYWWNRDT
ncbi:hypothetical protein ALC62_05739 [Cyphomyrmex costatus]|uniref:exodeoxyribonuclease III n=1 Tax=Cyphomyrmex costatus TaxID=456900 RepID=A0A151IJG5_9HYME|nr:hypothetical protein ALC62_05739 [Cyphomyrmex costatus]